MNETRPRFMLDIDGVCANWLANALVIIEIVTGRKYVPEDFPTWDVFDLVCVGMSEAEAAHVKQECNRHFHAEGFCLFLPVYAGAVEGVERVQELAAVRVVTASTHSRHWYFERGEWVQRHLRIDPLDVHHTRHKEEVYADIFLDDNPKHVEAWAVNHPLGYGLLWDQPYNRGEIGHMQQAPGNARRVDSWDEVVEAVRHYAQ